MVSSCGRSAISCPNKTLNHTWALGVQGKLLLHALIRVMGLMVASLNVNQGNQIVRPVSFQTIANQHCVSMGQTYLILGLHNTSDPQSQSVVEFQPSSLIRESLPSKDVEGSHYKCQSARLGSSPGCPLGVGNLVITRSLPPIVLELRVIQLSLQHWTL